jgi:hypothetical protein
MRFLFAFSLLCVSNGLNIVIPGGTGKLGNQLLPRLSDHDVVVLSRNAFLASAPSRVTEVFGYLGQPFLTRFPNVHVRDWDGGDLLDIVGDDFLGWQEDTLSRADVVVHLVGGYTNQRELATERLVRESLRVNKGALQITVNPVDRDIPVISPGMVTLKTERINRCESMVQENLSNVQCLRFEAYRDDEACDEICRAISEWEQQLNVGKDNKEEMTT